MLKATALMVSFNVRSRQKQARVLQLLRGTFFLIQRVGVVVFGMYARMYVEYRS